MPSTLTARLVTTTHPARAWLQFYGAPVPVEIRAIVLAAGWRDSFMVPLVALPEEYFTATTKTGAFLPPAGPSDEAAAAQKRVRAALKTCGIALPRGVAHLTFADLI